MARTESLRWWRNWLRKPSRAFIRRSWRWRSSGHSGKQATILHAEIHRPAATLRTTLLGLRRAPTASIRSDGSPSASAAPVPKQTLEQLQRLADDLKQRDEKLWGLLADKENLDGELKRLRAEVAALKKANAEWPDTHDYCQRRFGIGHFDIVVINEAPPLGFSKIPPQF